MKFRYCLVANSSSSAFILDIRDPRVQELLEKVKAPPAWGLGRYTAQAVGKEAIAFARDWLEEYKHEDNSESLGKWILQAAKELGEDNVVFLRESDEGIRGRLSGPEPETKKEYEKSQALLHQVEELAIYEREYH